MDVNRGKFIVLDGGDGSGKSTVSRAVADRLRDAGRDVTECKDPGGTEVGDRIRGVLLDHDLSGMAVSCEALLFMASRAQLVTEVVRPALDDGHVVLCDRYVSSTCAYQGAAGCDIDTIIGLARYAIGNTWPDLTIILDVPPDVGFERIGQRTRRGANIGPEGIHLDAMERRPLSFHEKVRENFLALPSRYPTPVEVIDGTRPLEVVTDAIMDRLSEL